MARFLITARLICQNRDNKKLPNSFTQRCQLIGNLVSSFWRNQVAPKRPDTFNRWYTASSTIFFHLGLCWLHPTGQTQAKITFSTEIKGLSDCFLKGKRHDVHIRLCIRVRGTHSCSLERCQTMFRWPDIGAWSSQWARIPPCTNTRWSGRKSYHPGEKCGHE